MADMFEAKEQDDRCAIRATRYPDASVIRVRDEDSGWTYIRLTKEQTEDLATFLDGR
jgi:hypothetical protein